MHHALFHHPFGVAREMDRLFDSMLASQPTGFVPAIRSPWTYPAINVWEDESTIYAEAELPGLVMDDIEVLVTDQELTIKGTRGTDVPEGARALRRERAIGTFSRTIEVASPIDANEVEAKLVHGVLTVTMPKAERCKPRRISVKTAPALPDSE